MPPVMGVRKTSSDIQGMCKHIWLKIFLNKSMQICRDVRKSQISTTYNKKVIKLQLYICRRTKVNYNKKRVTGITL